MSVTTIEWTKRPGTIGETLNPTTGCNKVDRGCKHCYAEIMHKRLQAMGNAKYAAPFLAGAVPHPEVLDIPMHWKKPRTVFVNSMSDLFHKDVPFDFIAEFFQVMQLTPQHTYLVLTKRPDIAVRFWDWMARTNRPQGELTWEPPANLWIGTSANDQKSAEERVPTLLLLDATVRFLSYEPATGPLKLRSIKCGPGAYMDAMMGLQWVICGGESGPKAEPMHPAWARQVRDDCQAAEVPFFFKQWGAWEPFTATAENGTAITRFTNEPNVFTFTEPSLQTMRKVGKHKSGHDLDGEVWQQFPNLETEF